MKRLVLASVGAALFCGIAVPGALGFFAEFDYQGHVKGEPTAFVGFKVDRSPGGAKKVHEFIVAQVPYTCTDSPSGTTTGWRFEPKMRVRPDRTFEGRGDWLKVGLDPVGTVSGKLRRGGVAVGQFKLRGELAGAGTHCKTGLLEWRATKAPPPPTT